MASDGCTVDENFEQNIFGYSKRNTNSRNTRLIHLCQTLVMYFCPFFYCKMKGRAVVRAPLRVNFHQRLISIEIQLPLKVVCHQRLYAIKSFISLKVSIPLQVNLQVMVLVPCFGAAAGVVAGQY